MFRPNEMVKLEVITLNRYKDSLITYLHETGVVELREVSVETAQKDTPNEFYRKAASYSIGLSRLVEFLGSFREESGGGIKGFIFPEEPRKETYRYRGIENIIKDVETFLKEAEPNIKNLEGRINAVSTEIEKIKTEISILELLTDLNIDVSYLRGTDFLEIVAGTVEKDKYGPMLDEITRALEGKVAYVSRESRGAYLVVIATLRRDFDRINPILAKYSFSRLEVPEGRGTPSELIRELEEKLGKKERELEELQKEGRALADKYYEKLVFYQELTENEREKANALGMLARTNMTFALRGWAPKEEVPRIVEGIKKLTDGKAYVKTSEPDLDKELDDVPIKLKNPGWARPFEMLTEMFGVPKYNEFDPTPIMAFTYSFFFGFMLTDFMYGLLMGAIAFLLVKGHSRFNDGTYKFAKIMLWSAVFTMLMGIVFGSYFGDALIKVGNALGFNVPYAIDAMRGALTVLIMALSIGLAHLFVGYTMGFINRLKNGDRVGAITEQLSWMLIILSVTLLALSIMKAPLKSVGIGLFAIGFVLFVVAELRSDLPFLMKILMTISDFFGFVGNWLSYARLMALALATSGIAMVINILVGMIWGVKLGPVPLGVAIGLVLFIGGHIFSTAINALGAFVHALRLHYVEFFSTFYSGEGRRFEPFRAKRKVSKLELEV